MTTPPVEEVARPLYPAGPTSPELVAAWSKKPQDTALEATVAAVNVVVRRWLSAPVEGQPWPVDHELGTRLLVSRLHSRKDSPGGVAQVTEVGIIYAARQDPDVAMLLGIGSWAMPVVG